MSKVKEIDFRITKARTGLIQRHPFWGTLALYLKVIEDPNLQPPTMATDGKHLYYAPSFLDKCTEKEIEGVLAHEVSHCAYRHPMRRGNKKFKLWNAACDYAVNRDLIAAKFELPEKRLYDKRFDGLSAEQIYDILLHEQKNEDDAPDYSACGELLDAAPASAEAELADLAAEWDIRLRQAVSVAKGRGAGQLPDYIRRMFEIANKPTVDWRARLRAFVDAGARFDYSWSRPNRNLFSIGIITPGMVPDGINQLGIILDTSGSVLYREKMMQSFLNELQGLMDESATQRLVFVCADWEIKTPQIFEFGDKVDVKVEGGGGTSFAPAINWFKENEPDCAALIYFTDLEVYGSGWGDDPGIPVLWVTYGPADEVESKIASVPYGEVVHIMDN